MLEHPVKRNVLLRGYGTELAVNLSVYFTFRDNVPHKESMRLIGQPLLTSSIRMHRTRRGHDLLSPSTIVVWNSRAGILHAYKPL
jgi:hypothetical protein